MDGRFRWKRGLRLAAVILIRNMARRLFMSFLAFIHMACLILAATDIICSGLGLENTGGLIIDMGGTGDIGGIGGIGGIGIGLLLISANTNIALKCLMGHTNLDTMLQ